MIRPIQRQNARADKSAGLGSSAKAGVSRGEPIAACDDARLVRTLFVAGQEFDRRDETHHEHYRIGIRAHAQGPSRFVHWNRLAGPDHRCTGTRADSGDSRELRAAREPRGTRIRWARRSMSSPVSAGFRRGAVRFARFGPGTRCGSLPARSTGTARGRRPRWSTSRSRNISRACTSPGSSRCPTSNIPPRFPAELRAHALLGEHAQPAVALRRRLVRALPPERTMHLPQ